MTDTKREEGKKHLEGFTKVEKEKIQTEKNEIRVTAKGEIRSKFRYAQLLFEKEGHKTIEIRGTGNAIVKALILIEMIKRRIGNLHQITRITSSEIIDEYEPNIEGLEKIQQVRRVTCLHCTFS
jgi:ribonucleases P/MRP protein subunit RPP25